MTSQKTTDTNACLAKDWMSSHVVSLHSGSTVHEAIQLMVENRVSALPIVDTNNHCVGIITTTDLVDIAYEVDDDVSHTDPFDPIARRRLVEHLTSTVGHEPVSTYMSETVTTAFETVTLRAAAKMMVKDQVHHLPIVNANDELVGILSSMDILANLADKS